MEVTKLVADLKSYKRLIDEAISALERLAEQRGEYRAPGPHGQPKRKRGRPRKHRSKLNESQ